MIWEMSTLTLGVMGVVGVVPAETLDRNTETSSVCHISWM
jgi:hypothetical protein